MAQMLEFIRKELQNAKINTLKGLVKRWRVYVNRWGISHRKLEIFLQSQRKKC